MSAAQIVTIILALIGLLITIGGLVFGLARMLTNTASRSDVDLRFSTLEKKVEVLVKEAHDKIEAKSRESTQNHASFMTRHEFDRLEKDRERRLDELHDDIKTAISDMKASTRQLSEHYGALLEAITGLASQVTARKAGNNG